MHKLVKLDLSLAQLSPILSSLLSLWAPYFSLAKILNFLHGLMRNKTIIIPPTKFLAPPIVLFHFWAEKGDILIICPSVLNLCMRPYEEEKNIIIPHP